MNGVLRKMVRMIDPNKVSQQPVQDAHELPQSENESSTITHDWFWPRISSFLKDNDILVTDPGTASFGLWDTKLPMGAMICNQILWASIGFSVGACQGALMAVKDSNLPRRVVLFVGDGSFQIAAQELSTIIREGLTPIM